MSKHNARHPAPSAPRRVLGYLRVSTGKQADSGLSIASQRAKVRGYAELYGLELVDVLVDAGASASTLDRPALTDALARLDAGGADALLVAKLDRLTRSVRDLGDLVDRCNRRGWALLSVADNLDTQSAAGRMVMGVLAVVSQWEREAIGERTAAAMAVKAARGEHCGGGVPYGFHLADGGRLLPDDDEQATIRTAAALRAKGLSLRAVGAALTLRGLLPRSGRAWTAQGVSTVLNARVAA